LTFFLIRLTLLALGVLAVLPFRIAVLTLFSHLLLFPTLVPPTDHAQTRLGDRSLLISFMLRDAKRLSAYQDLESGVVYRVLLRF
jgi:hypothetical protein